MRLTSLPPLVGLVLALVLAAPAMSQQEPTASHLAAARELVMVSGAYGTIEHVVPEIADEIRKQAVTRPEMTKDLTDILKALQPEMDRQRDEGVALAARAYAKHLTEPEIKDVVAFFKTPVGVKYIKVQPDLTDDLVAVMTTWSQTAAEYVQTRVRAEMQKRGHQMQ